MYRFVVALGGFRVLGLPCHFNAGRGVSAVGLYVLLELVFMLRIIRA